MLRKVAFAVLTTALVAGCASKGDLEEVKATADAALAKATSAEATANAASAKADEAAKAAAEANERAERMLQKATRK